MRLFKNKVTVKAKRMSYAVSEVIILKKIVFGFFCTVSVMFLAIPVSKMSVSVRKYLNAPAEAAPALFDSRREVASPVITDGGVIFSFYDEGAKKVLLGGSFNNYDAGKNPMEKNAEGIWETTIPLKKGKHTYKFKVDGKWVLDPGNLLRTPPPKQSSVVTIK